MKNMTHLNNNENIQQLPDDFAIKNFILMQASEIPEGLSLEHPFLFNGIVFGVCIKGNATFKINYRIYEISTNEIFTILPNQIFKIIEQSPGLMIEVLYLSADYTLKLPLPKSFDLLKKINGFPTQKIDPEEVHNILEMHSLISKHYRNDANPYKDLMIMGLIYSLLMEIAYLYENSSVSLPKNLSRQEVLTESFFNVLIEYYLKERSVAFYAEKLYLTPKYLSMAVKKITGHSIIDWINEAIIIEIKKRLKTTDHTMLQISEELNFPNPSYFGRFFKQHAGLTPLEYRNS